MQTYVFILQSYILLLINSAEQLIQDTHWEFRAIFEMSKIKKPLTECKDFIIDWKRIVIITVIIGRRCGTWTSVPITISVPHYLSLFCSWWFFCCFLGLRFPFQLTSAFLPSLLLISIVTNRKWKTFGGSMFAGNQSRSISRRKYTSKNFH